MNSIEKIHELAQDYAGPPPPDIEPIELAIRSAVSMIGPMFLELLPDDAGEVDLMLEEMSDRLLSLRSDRAGDTGALLERVVDGRVEPAGELEQRTG